MDEEVEILLADETAPVGDPPPRPALTVLLAVVAGVAYLVVQTVVVIGFLALELVRNPKLDIDVWAEQATSNGTILAVATCLASLVTVLLMIGSVALLSRGHYRPGFIREFFLLRWPGVKHLAIWLPAVIAYIFAADWLSGLLGHEITSEFMVEAYRSAGSVALLWVAIVVVAPVHEELLFRGFLFRGLISTRLGCVGAAIITSLAWALIHIQYDWHVIFVIFLGGLLLAAARQSSQSLVTCILMHATWNLAATVQTMLTVARGH